MLSVLRIVAAGTLVAGLLAAPARRTVSMHEHQPMFE